MKITNLQLFSDTDQVAWVGAGGKTSLIFSIARELFAKKCVITTSTRMAKEEVKNSDQTYRFIQLKTSDLENEEISGVSLIYKDIDETDNSKIKGFDELQLQTISHICKIKEIPLLIEADGAKRKSFKFPAKHEPNIPQFVNKVCVVVGLSVIGKPLSEQHFHRPNEISNILNVPLGEIITIEHINYLLTHPDGGLKNIPEKAEKIVFLHQADQMSRYDGIDEFALNLRKHFDHVILSCIDEKDLNVIAHWGKVGCIILAAGAGTRFGGPKQLAIYKNKTFIENVIETAFQVDFEEIVVVLGAYFSEIITKIRNLKIQVLKNEDWEQGQATSVKLGVIKLIDDKLDAILFLLVDQPQISSDLIKNVIKSFAYNKPNIIVHSFKGQIRHPILFSRNTFSDLIKIEGDQGGRQLFNKYKPFKIFLEDSQMAIDIDTVEDLREL